MLQRDRSLMFSSTNFSLFNLFILVLGGFVLLFVIAPLAGMFLNCTVGELVETAQDEAVRRSIWLTLWTSMAGTAFFAFFAVPFSYLLARKNFPFKRIITGIIDIPVVIPHSAAGIAILGVISRNSMPGKIAGKLGFSFIGSPAGIMIAMAFVSLPFLINSAREGFSAVPERLEKAALTLGASHMRMFFTISLPLAWRSVLIGLILMWARGLSEFGAVIIVAYQPMITPVLIYERYSSYGLKYARPVAVLFIIVCLIIFVFLRLLAGNKHART